MRERIDSLIESICAEVQDLPDLEECWGEMDEHQRLAAAYDWELVIVGAYLVSLQRRRETGELS